MTSVKVLLAALTLWGLVACAYKAERKAGYDHKIATQSLPSKEVNINLAVKKALDVFDVSNLQATLEIHASLEKGNWKVCISTLPPNQVGGSTCYIIDRQAGEILQVIGSQ
jgi:hypothetical protein